MYHYFREFALASDYNHADIKLRFSEDGYLTGDMDLLLPPVHNVKLDLFTGSVTLIINLCLYIN